MSRPLTRLALPGLALALLLTHAAPGAAQTTLRYKFREGEALNYVLDMKMVMKINADGKDLDMTMNMGMDVVMRTVSVNKNGTSRQAMRIGRIRLDADFLGQKLEYDTKDGKLPEGPGAEAFAALKEITGHDITMTQDARGQTTDFALPKALLEALKKAQEGGGGPALSEEELKKMTDQAAILLPEGAVSRGDRWTQKLTPTKSGGMEMAIENHCTYEGPVTKDGKKLENIGLKPTITVKPGPDAPPDLKVKDVTAKGVIYFDNVAGRLHEMNFHMDMNMEGPQVTMNMKMTVEFKLKR